MITRRQFLFRAAGVTAGGALGGVGWMSFAEPHWLRVSRHEVALGSPSLPARRALRVLHLSDFHASECVSLEHIERSVKLGLTLEPDLICLTGDFISWRYEAWDRFTSIFAALSKRAPTFACLGNHDGGRWAASSRKNGYPDASEVRAMLQKAGIELLVNASRLVQIGDWGLTLVGVGDLWNKELDCAVAFAGVAPDTTTVLLCHNPDAKELVRAFPWDLMLCGHTHGGQCRIPFIGTPFAPVRDHRFVEGLHRWSDRWIHITRGVGNLHGLRFNCRPEVSLLTVHV